MGKGTKIGVGIGVAVVLLIGLGVAGYIASQNVNTNQGSATNAPSQNEVTPVVDENEQDELHSTTNTKSVLDLLPTRRDIGTEWRISPLAYNNTNAADGYLGNSNTALIEGGAIASGYEDGVSQDYTSKAVIQVTLSSFDFKENAEKYHNAITTELYEKGGFKQVDTSSISAKCFSVFRELDLATISELYCVKENVFFSVKEYGGISTYGEDVKDTTIQFAKIMGNKITARLASAQELGSFSLATFTEKVCSSADGCTTSIALANHNISPCGTIANNNGCISAYAIKFNEPKDCSDATNSLDCFKTVSVSLGDSVCSLTQSASDRVECGKYYITAAQLRDHYSSDEIQEVCSPTFLHSNFLVQQTACKIEQLNLQDISKSDLLTWKTGEQLTVCSRFPNNMGENEEEYCLASVGVYLKDLSVCDQAGDARAECYGFVAVTEDSVDLDACDRLEGTGVTFCYMHVAYRTNDISICDKTDTNKENCIRLVNSKNA